MRKIALAIAATAALLSGPAIQAKAPRLTGEEKLAKLLEGRVAGQPVSCISLMNTRDTRIIDKTAIVYDTGRVIYVNRPRYPSSLDSDDIMVTRPTGSQLCRLDVVQMRDRSTFFYSGFVGLEDFVPYRKVALRD
jgi:hypothetical protein